MSAREKLCGHFKAPDKLLPQSTVQQDMSDGILIGFGFLFLTHNS